MKKIVLLKKNVMVNFILDETGSMDGCKDATISGFNEYVDNLKRQNGKIRFSLTKFNSEKIDRPFIKTPIKDVTHLSNRTYNPANMTPLYDAIGRTVKSLDKEKGKVLCVIMTDGEENASKEYKREDIFKMIKRKEKDGWSFVFLGANQDAWKTSQSLGMYAGNTMSYNTRDTRKTFLNVGTCTMSYLASGSDGTVDFFKKNNKKTAKKA